ncbi:MAG: hypothetical protein M1533_01445 [Candidatus Thermoplasmatota archaeon]|jgi:hypothetical protein|nr:hypothetical protein [Candidatus Thermoplasmatota archaeon]MCL5793834.1 hypothetical protein [Candidatus Thermoplasmatota archaeon]
MKLSAMIGTAAFSVIVVIMLIAVASMYQATYGSTNFEVTSETVYYTTSGPVLAATIHASDNSYLPSNLQALNYSGSVPGMGSSVFNISMPLNLSSLMGNLWPVHNVTMNVSTIIHIVSFILSDAVPLAIKGIRVLAPFAGFAIGNVTAQKNGTYLVSATFTYLLPLALEFTSIAVHHGSALLGNLTIGSVGASQKVSATGYINSPGSGGPTNLTMSAGSFSWTEEAVTFS